MMTNEKEIEVDDEREWPDPKDDPEEEPAEPWARKEISEE